MYPSIAADEGVDDGAVEDGARDDDLEPEALEAEEADETGADEAGLEVVVPDPDAEIRTPRAQLPPHIFVLSPVQLAVHLSSPSRRASTFSVFEQ